MLNGKLHLCSSRFVLVRSQPPDLLVFLYSLTRDERSYHLWLELPDRWRAETFVSVAARRGIAVTPAATFAVVPGHAPNAVRLALASPALDDLPAALKTIATICNGERDMNFAS